MIITTVNITKKTTALLSIGGIAINVTMKPIDGLSQHLNSAPTAEVTTGVRMMLTNEEIIKELEMIELCYDLLEKETKALDEAKDIIRASAWIPAEDEPPKQKKTYWVCTDDGYQCECKWTNVNQFWTDLTTDWHWSISQHSRVVAWRQLPEPYKCGDNE